jgi:hypothetical protein
MSTLDMFEGICGSSAETLSKVRVRVYLIFNFSILIRNLNHEGSDSERCQSRKPIHDILFFLRFVVTRS